MTAPNFCGTSTQARWATEEYTRRLEQWEDTKKGLAYVATIADSEMVATELKRLESLAGIMFKITKASYWIRHRHETIIMMLDKLETRLYTVA